MGDFVNGVFFGPVDEVMVVLCYLDPDAQEAFRIVQKRHEGELTRSEMHAHLRQLAKQKREREAKQRLEEVRAYVDRYIKEARRRGQL